LRRAESETGRLASVAFGAGVLFSPFGGEWQPGLLPHALTVLLEGEAYVVVMLGVWL
jgi:hypothetical protein